MPETTPIYSIRRRGSRRAERLPPVSLLLVVLLASACQKKPGETAGQVDTTSIAAELDSTMRHHFSAFERGDIATWSSLLAEDVFFTAAGPADVFAGRNSARVKMEEDIGRVIGSGITLSIQPLSHLSWIADQGRTAGATYDLDYRVSYQEQRFSYRLRAAYLVERDTTGWKVLAAQYSRPVVYDTLFMALLQGIVPGTVGIGELVPAAAGDVVQRFRTDIRDIGQATIANDAAIVTPGALVKGPEQGRRELAQWLGPVGNANEAGDGVRGGLNSSGTVGWVATNLRVPVFAGPESVIAPMRALFVYRLAGTQWELVQASLSVGLKGR